MTKEKRILSYFIGWLLLGFIICFIGITNVFALEFEKPNYINFYDNTGTTLTSLGATCDEVRCISEQTATLVASSTGAAIAFQLDTQLIKGYNYSVTIFVDIKDSNDDDGISLSSKNYIGIGSNVTNARNNYINKTGVTINTSYAGRNHIYYNFTVTSSTASQYIVIPFTTKQTVQNAYIRFWGSELISNGSGLTENQIDSITNNQTTILNNSIQNSTNTITGEIDDMEQSIIDSNKETQEVIKDQFNDCGKNIVESVNWIHGYLFLGELTKSDYYATTEDFLEIETNKLYNFNAGKYDFLRITLYDKNKRYLDYQNVQQPITNRTFTDENIKYMKISVRYFVDGSLTIIDLNELKNSNIYVGSAEICSNKIDDTNDKLNDIAGAITDSSSPDLDALNNTAGWLPPGPVDSILNLPLNMLQSLNTALSQSCTPLNLTFPFVNKSWQMPCISTLYQKIEGFNTLWTWLGSIASILMLYTYLLKLYKWVDDTLSFRENNHIDNWGGV